MKEMTIVVGTDFTRTPIGRYLKESKWSGEAFREDKLIPALTENEKVIVDLSGVAGYGSSFLEEAFGGLVRSGKFTQEVLKDRLVIYASDPTYQPYVDCVKRYMDEAWQTK